MDARRPRDERLINRLCRHRHGLCRRNNQNVSGLTHFCMSKKRIDPLNTQQQMGTLYSKLGNEQGLGLRWESACSQNMAFKRMGMDLPTVYTEYRVLCKLANNHVKPTRCAALYIYTRSQQVCSVARLIEYNCKNKDSG